MRCLLSLVSLSLLSPFFSYARSIPQSSDATQKRDATVLILGGGVAGVIAARTLHEHGIDDFKIVEARSELGGQLQNFKFGVPGNQHSLELGANWVQGTETNGGPENPIWGLVKKHSVKTRDNDWEGELSRFSSIDTTCDPLGPDRFIHISNLRCHRTS